VKLSIPSIPLVLAVAALGCASASPVAESQPTSTAEQAAPTAEPKQPAAETTPVPAPPAPKAQTFGFKDFLSIAGVGARSTLNDVEKAWGKGERDGDKIRYKDGPTVSVMLSGGLMIDIHLGAERWVKEHASGPVSIWGMTCAEAAAALDFTDTVGNYTTCKHYEKDLYLDVTLMCGGGRVNTLAVVWYPYDPADAPNPLPPDHCN